MDIPDGRYHLVSDILVQHRDGTYLLTKRPPGKDIYPGYWEASAGGSAQLGEGPEECAKRELFEESGICDADVYPVCDYLGYDDYGSGITLSYVKISKRCCYINC